MQRVINNPKYPNVDSSLRAWNNYMYAFGLGHRLGVDVPTEQKEIFLHQNISTTPSDLARASGISAASGQ